MCFSFFLYLHGICSCASYIICMTRIVYVHIRVIQSQNCTKLYRSFKMHNIFSHQIYDLSMMSSSCRINNPHACMDLNLCISSPLTMLLHLFIKIITNYYAFCYQRQYKLIVQIHSPLIALLE